MDYAARSLPEKSAETVTLRKKDRGTLPMDLFTEDILEGVVGESISDGGERCFDAIDIFGQQRSDAKRTATGAAVVAVLTGHAECGEARRGCGLAHDGGHYISGGPDPRTTHRKVTVFAATFGLPRK